VLAGIESGNYVEILNGVTAGENIVISGQFLIDSEASMRGSIRRLTDAVMSEYEMVDMEMK
jgi:Cu(I)/Ag(I) efflux system membrane fusion protein